MSRLYLVYLVVNSLLIDERLSIKLYSTVEVKRYLEVEMSMRGHKYQRKVFFVNLFTLESRRILENKLGLKHAVVLFIFIHQCVLL